MHRNLKQEKVAEDDEEGKEEEPKAIFQASLQFHDVHRLLFAPEGNAGN